MKTTIWSSLFSLTLFLRQNQPIMSVIAKDICVQYMSCLPMILQVAWVIGGSLDRRGRPIEYAKFYKVENDNIIENL
jgi:hypothetical protein